MKVETYETISLDEQNGEIVNELVSEEALALITELGLEGQQTLIERTQAGGEEVVKRMPYRQITAEERAVYGAVMPYRTELRSYRDGAIPLRVLQIAAHAKELFDSLEVWHPEAGRDDPLLVGYKKSGQWGRDTYILARWGEELVDFETLRTKARKIIRAKVEADIASAEAKIAQYKAGMVNAIDSYLLGGSNRTEYLPNLSFGS